MVLDAPLHADAGESTHCIPAETSLFTVKHASGRNLDVSVTCVPREMCYETACVHFTAFPPCALMFCSCRHHIHMI